MYRREQYHTLMERMAEPRKFIQVIAGPRQVGKSTLVKQVIQDCSLPYTLETADAIDPENGEWIANVWESVRQQMSFRQQTEHLLVIDEIHKIKNWSEQIKREWDNDTGLVITFLPRNKCLLMSWLQSPSAVILEPQK